MKNILVIGATGQIGSELTLELRKRYGDDHVIAGYIPSAMPKGELTEGSVKQYVNQIYSKLHIEGDQRTKRRRLAELLAQKA